MKLLERRLTLKEQQARIFHKSSLALLILPLFAPDASKSTGEYAREFANNFNIHILQENDFTLDFINGLEEWQRNRIRRVLIMGGMQGTEYASGTCTFSVPETLNALPAG